MPSGPEWFIVLAVVLVIFGGSQLPKLARNLGKAQKEFKDGLSEAQQEDEATKANAADTSAAARIETKVDNVDKVEKVEKPES